MLIPTKFNGYQAGIRLYPSGGGGGGLAAPQTSQEAMSRGMAILLLLEHLIKIITAQLKIGDTHMYLIGQFKILKHNLQVLLLLRNHLV